MQSLTPEPGTASIFLLANTSVIGIDFAVTNNMFGHHALDVEGGSLGSLILEAAALQM